jgi:transcriptional regulator with XRE-family HTH domain
LKLKELKDYLKLLQISQVEFCDKIGISQGSFLKSYNNIDNLKVKTLKMISKAMNIPIEKVLFDLKIIGKCHQNIENSEFLEKVDKSKNSSIYSEKLISTLENTNITLKNTIKDQKDMIEWLRDRVEYLEAEKRGDLIIQEKQKKLSDLG